MVTSFSMNPSEDCKCNRTKKQLINVPKSLMLKAGRGSGSVDVDYQQVVLIYSNKSAKNVTLF